MNSKPVNSRSMGGPLPDGPGIGDDIPCSKCGAPLDTGLECTECDHDMAPELEATQGTADGGA